MKDQFRHIIRQKLIESQTVDLPALTQRDVWLPKAPGKALAVIGMRRAGKTSFLWQQIAHRHASGTAREGMVYFSFEDDRLAGLSTEHLDLLVEEYFLQHPEWRNGRRASFFLDEIQCVPGWETFIRRLLDTEKIDIFLSGSSAKLLSREVATSMRGRALEATVTPFSFKEVLRHHGSEPTTPPSRISKAQRSRITHDLLQYLVNGGFPEAQNLDQRSRLELLRNYIDVVLLRDVSERHNISQPQVLRWLVQQLLGNGAGSFSINKFHSDLRSRGVSVGKETLHDMLAHLEDAFLVKTLKLCTESVRRQQVNARKVYPVDQSLMALFDRSGKENTGHALETAVLHELLRMGAELSYLHTRSGYEVDFVAQFPDGTTWLVQVCLDLTDTQTLQREVRALTDAGAEWPAARRMLIALHRPAVLDLPTGVECHSAVDCLLGGWH